MSVACRIRIWCYINVFSLSQVMNDPDRAFNAFSNAPTLTLHLLVLIFHHSFHRIGSRVGSVASPRTCTVSSRFSPLAGCVDPAWDSTRHLRVTLHWNLPTLAKSPPMSGVVVMAANSHYQTVSVHYVRDCTTQNTLPFTTYLLHCVCEYVWHWGEGGTQRILRCKRDFEHCVPLHARRKLAVHKTYKTNQSSVSQRSSCVQKSQLESGCNTTPQVEIARIEFSVGSLFAASSSISIFKWGFVSTAKFQWETELPLELKLEIDLQVRCISFSPRRFCRFLYFCPFPKK